MDASAKPAMFEASPDARLLRARLKRAEVGELVTYTELSGVVSRTVTGAFGPLRTALRSLLNDEGRAFGVVRGVGMKRLSDVEIVEAADGDVDSIRRKARRSARRLTAVQHYDKLEPKQQLAHTARLSIFGAISSMTTDSAIKKVEAAATGRATELPIAETLKAFTA